MTEWCYPQPHPRAATCEAAGHVFAARLAAVEAEIARLTEALRYIAADWHRDECPETELCDCHLETARNALDALALAEGVER